LIMQGLVARLLKPRREGLLNLKDLLAVFPPRRGAAFSGFVRRPKWGEANLLISHLLLADFPRRAGERVLHLKDLQPVSPPSGRATLSRLVGRMKRCEDDPVDSTRVVGNVAEESRRTSAPSKGLANWVSSEP